MNQHWYVLEIWGPSGQEFVETRHLNSAVDQHHKVASYRAYV